MAFAADKVTDRDVGHARTDLDDLAGEFVAHRQWWLESLLRPVVPRLEVQVGAADASHLYLHQHIACSDGGNRNVHELEPGSGPRFYKAFH